MVLEKGKESFSEILKTGGFLAVILDDLNEMFAGAWSEFGAFCGVGWVAAGALLLMV